MSAHGLVLALVAAGILGIALVLERDDAESERAAPFELRGTVTRVVDGDTVRVRVDGRTERVRLIGIDAPESGACLGTESLAALRRLALNRDVVLHGDRTQPRRDVYERLLAYVQLASGADAGLRQLRLGLARVYRTRRPFARRDAYEAAAAAARRERRGLHGAC